MNPFLMKKPAMTKPQTPLNRAETQKNFADYVRSAESGEAPPLGIEPRRIKIYQNLIYNNIQSFLASNFPVLKSLLDEQLWNEFVAAFLKYHRSSSPYFKDIAEEFQVFLSEEGDVQRELLARAPGFTLELAHYEWVEMVLDTRDEEWPGEASLVFDKEQGLVMSPLAWSLAYHYPVHQISREFQPEEPAAQPCCLLVYRNLEDKICFIEINPLTSAMLEMICLSDSPVAADDLLQSLAVRLSLPLDNIYQPGMQILENFCEKAILGCVSLQA